MTSILDNIVARKRIEVEKARAATPLDTLKQRIADMPRPRNFFAAVVSDRRPPRARVIAEIKRRSPSAGSIGNNFDPVRIARQYHEAGAAAISCLTDEENFGGHLGYIQQIREAVPLPVLRKDFIVDQYQVWESRAAGADAMLLIAEVLEEGHLVDMMILARELNMTTLVEAHEVERLLTALEKITEVAGRWQKQAERLEQAIAGYYKQHNPLGSNRGKPCDCNLCISARAVLEGTGHREPGKE